jgi:hypothetical protein
MNIFVFIIDYCFWKKQLFLLLLALLLCLSVKENNQGKQDNSIFE